MDYTPRRLPVYEDTDVYRRLFAATPPKILDGKRIGGALDDWSAVDTTLAERIVALGSRVARPVWTRAQQLLLWRRHHGGGR